MYLDWYIYGLRGEIMYKCDECGYVFDEPKTYSEDLTPGLAFEGGSFIKEYEGCPLCEGQFHEIVEEEEEC